MQQCFYVDNCLQSVPTPEEAKELVDKLHNLLAADLAGGFELRQWVSNTPSVISHLPKDARSDSIELSHGDPNHAESALGLSWHWESDRLGYKHRPMEYGTLTMWNVYKVLARQYDPLGTYCHTRPGQRYSSSASGINSATGTILFFPKSCCRPGRFGKQSFRCYHTYPCLDLTSQLKLMWSPGRSIFSTTLQREPMDRSHTCGQRIPQVKSTCPFW